MLSAKGINKNNVGKTASYYEDAADDYYAKEGESRQWQGKGAEALGLSGDVDSTRFRQLLNGHINDNERISRASTRKDSKTRMAMDLTFSAPKSVSLQALVGNDPKMVQAHDRAVEKAVNAVEEKAKARQKVNGKSRLETTGNLVVAKFRHETSREQDPQLHTHALVMNMTRRSDGKWRALHNDEIVDSVKMLGAEYRSQLAKELQAEGYPLRFDKDGGWELAHISREQVEHFSKRTQQIDERLEIQGLTRMTASTEQKNYVTVVTRAPKVETSRDELRAGWENEAAKLGINFSNREWEGAGAQVNSQGQPTGKTHQGENAGYQIDQVANQSVRFAVRHITERQSAMTHKELVGSAMAHGVGRVTLADVSKEIKAQVKGGQLVQEDRHYAPADDAKGTMAQTREGWTDQLVKTGMQKAQAKERVQQAIEKGGLVAQEPRYTTQVALEREKRILQIEREGRGTFAPVADENKASDLLSSWEAKEGKTLNSGQRESATLMLSTQDRVIGVHGLAGVGKSFMLQGAKASIESQGYNVRTLAPYGSQVKNLRGDGIDANTVQSFLYAKDKKIDSNTVMVVDEAGVVPSKQMARLLQIAEKEGARVVLMGDTAQTKAIESGRPFDQLINHGMKTARMDDILRQRDERLKKAVEMASGKEARESVAHISSVVEVKDDQSRYQKIANDYGELTQAQRDNAIVVTGTNEARREINTRIREGIGLKGQGSEVETLHRRDTTKSERRYSRYYKVGEYVSPERDYDKVGLKKNQLYEIEDTGPGNRLTVRSLEDNSVHQFSPAHQSKLDVYEKEQSELAPGDLVRVNRHDAKRDLANGDRFKVESVDDKGVTLSNGARSVRLDSDQPLHITYAYASTVHGSQGLTEDLTMYEAKTQSKSTSREVYYTAISRARDEVRLYTNDQKKIGEAVARENPKYTALDLTTKHQTQARDAALAKQQEQERSRATQQQEHEKSGKAVREAELE